MLWIITAVGCSSSSGGTSGGDGNLTVVLEAEDTIPEGLPSSDSPECEDECIEDRYSVTFSKYIVSAGLVDMAQANGANGQQSSVVTVADYTTLPTTDPEVDVFSGIPTGQYSEFGYETPVIDADTVNINDVSEVDIQNMITNDLTYIIRGTVTPDDGGDAIEFLIEADVPSVYTDCGEEPELGVNVGGGDNTASLSIHGDHIFFNGFPDEETGEAVTRLAKWMTLVPDTNEDGLLDKDDFEAADADELNLYPSPPYADINGGPAGAVNTAWDFIRSQLGTQGHLDSEGECDWGDI